MSTICDLANQIMIPDSGFMAWQHQHNVQALSLHSRLPGAGLHATSIVKLSASVKKTLFEKAALRKISPKLCPKCLWLDSQLTEPVNAGPESLLLLTSL